MCTDEPNRLQWVVLNPWLILMGLKNSHEHEKRTFRENQEKYGWKKEGIKITTMPYTSTKSPKNKLILLKGKKNYILGQCLSVQYWLCLSSMLQKDKSLEFIPSEYSKCNTHLYFLLPVAFVNQYSRIILWVHFRKLM